MKGKINVRNRHLSDCAISVQRFYSLWNAPEEPCDSGGKGNLTYHKPDAILTTIPHDAPADCTCGATRETKQGDYHQRI